MASRKIRVFLLVNGQEKTEDVDCDGVGIEPNGVLVLSAKKARIPAANDQNQATEILRPVQCYNPSSWISFREVTGQN